MQWLVAYDISSTKARNEVANLLTRYGYRIQYSVFYIPEASKSQIKTLMKAIKKMVNPRTDRVFFYPIEGFTLFEGYPLQPWDVCVL